MADDSLQTDVAARIDRICKDFETAWRRGDSPSIDDMVERANPADRTALRAELLAIERAYRAKGEAGTDSRVSTTTTADAGDAQRVSRQSPKATPPGDQPSAFGRYQVTGVLGKGGFGVVYRGFDPDLRREVAVKVPRRERVATSADSEAYLNEARVVASLNHSGIVPVHDCGRTDDGLCYVVSQVIPGGDLAALIARRRLSHIEVADLVSRIAEALHHAHRHGLVHRDIKPGNILIDEHGHPLVSDFGLVLTDDGYGRGSGISGTPSYMSPEQASGNGHRVDARSDVYSLGVVLYELLTGRRPYRHKEVPELLEEISLGDIRPPRQIDHTLPKELEAICLKALARLPGDRYATAFDLAEDLHQWQKQSQTTSRLATDPATRSRTFKLAIGCGSLLTISITTGAAFLLWLNARDVTTVALLKHIEEAQPDSMSEPASMPAAAPPIHWAGGFISQHEIVRPLGRYEQLRDYDRLIVRLAQLREAGHTGEEMADIVNAEGFRSPRGTHRYTGDIVRKLLSRSGLAKRHTGIAPEDRQRDPNEWWVEDLVQHLKIPTPTLEGWCRKGWILARKLTIAGRRWVIWADADEIQRLRRLRLYRRRAPSVPYPADLTTPKKRTA